MKYLTVKEVAEKFHVSEQIVKKLCEAGEVAGVQRQRSGWLIPADVEGLFERNGLDTGKESVFLSLTQVCAELSISIATGRNWIKTGKLIPHSEEEGDFFFAAEDISALKRDIQSGKNSALKSRRNKKFVSGSQVYQSYVSEGSRNVLVVQEILDVIHRNSIEVTNFLICALVAECALQFIVAKEQIAILSFPYLGEYLSGRLNLGEFAFLIDDLIEEVDGKGLLETYSELFFYSYCLEDGEDILGLLYISLKNIGSRKAAGAYYTPTVIVKKLCARLFSTNQQEELIKETESVFTKKDKRNKKFSVKDVENRKFSVKHDRDKGWGNVHRKSVFDPCCGTGNFLLQLPSNFSIEQIFGNDIDVIGVKITRINMALKYGVSDKMVLYQHFTVSDYLNHDFCRKFDFIIGNPPWGYDFTETEKKRWKGKYSSAAGSSIESYDIFVEQALHDLEQDGILSYILPEAILNVKTHMPIRKILMESGSIQYLEFLGNTFDKVQCPCIILQIKKGKQPFSCIGMTVKDKSRFYTLKMERNISPECFCFFTTDEEYKIIEKMISIPNKATLEGNASFALGIVTGNNKKYLSNQKDNSNEMVLKGADIYKFCFRKTENYIAFQPELFQQVAPVQYYRVLEKLLYRFISSQLVFAYDNQQTLSLNSCNILIPTIPGMNIKYIMAVLNSRAAQFYFEKQFHSVKVLRSHIEQIPIPLVKEETQAEIVKMVEEILLANHQIDSLYDESDSRHHMIQIADFHTIDHLYDRLDREITKLYGITEKEYDMIKTLDKGTNLFLYE